MIVFGVDLGIANTGLAVVRRKVSGFELLGGELVKSDAKMLKTERLLRIHEAVCRLIDIYQCELVAIERCYHNRNVLSSQSTGAVIGVCMAAAAREGLQVLELTPQQVKASTGLSGKCDKKAVVKMMSKILGESLNNHVADAATIAGCLFHRYTPK